VREVKKSVEELLEEQLEMLCESNEIITKFAAKNEICDSLVQVHETVNDSIIEISELLIGKNRIKKTEYIVPELKIRTSAQKNFIPEDSDNGKHLNSKMTTPD